MGIGIAKDRAGNVRWRRGRVCVCVSTMVQSVEWSARGYVNVASRSVERFSEHAAQQEQAQLLPSASA